MVRAGGSGRLTVDVTLTGEHVFIPKGGPGTLQGTCRRSASTHIVQGVAVVFFVGMINAGEVLVMMVSVRRNRRRGVANMSAISKQKARRMRCLAWHDFSVHAGIAER